MRGGAQINETELCAGLAEFTSTGSQTQFPTGGALPDASVAHGRLPGQEAFRTSRGSAVPRQVCAVVAAEKLRRGLLEGEGQHKAEHADDAEAHQV